MEEIRPGLKGKATMTVTSAETAACWAKELMPAFSTPALVGLMESAAVKALAGHLPAGYTTVGARIDIRHLVPTPVGMDVRAQAELMEVDRRRLVFHVEAWDEVERIGEATHERFVVDAERFMTRMQSKGTPESS